MKGKITIGVKWIHIPNAHNEYCGRGSVFGNPYPMLNKTDKERNRVCDLYETYYKDSANNPEHPIHQGLLKLFKLYTAGQHINLQCFCTPKRCHCETIKRSLEQAVYLIN